MFRIAAPALALALTILLTSLYVVIPAAACAPPQTPVPMATAVATPAPVWQEVRGDDYEGVIVPEAEAARFFRAADEVGRAGYWTPEADDVAHLERRLERFLEPLVDVMPAPCMPPSVPRSVMEHLDEYRRQYAGFTRDDGLRAIFVSFFCDAGGVDWRTEPVEVTGSACYFQVAYVPVDGSFFDLQVTGGEPGIRPPGSSQR